MRLKKIKLLEIKMTMSDRKNMLDEIKIKFDTGE